MNPIKLSILVSTIPSRLHTFYPRLIADLNWQSRNRADVEIIALYDNKKRSVGAKRNSLISLAQGEFLTFIDDDDRIAHDYVDSIMNCIDVNTDADCIVFDCITTINRAKTVYSKYSITYNYHELDGQWRGKPAHTMVWKSNIAKKHIYQDINFGEDVDWVIRACDDIKKEVRIDKVLYFYDFDSTVSETRG